MTTYGTIPAETAELSYPSFRTLVKQLIVSGFGTPRPWNGVIQPESFNLPISFGNFIERIQTNAAFYRMNYAIIILSIVFISLFWNPVSLIFLMILTAAWLFLYFLHDGDRLIVYGYEIDDRTLMTALLLVTIAFLFLTDVSKNIITGLSVGTLVVVAHAGLRSTDDVAPLPLQHAASTSFSSPNALGSCDFSNF